MLGPVLIGGDLLGCRSVFRKVRSTLVKGSDTGTTISVTLCSYLTRRYGLPLCRFLKKRGGRIRASCAMDIGNPRRVKRSTISCIRRNFGILGIGMNGSSVLASVREVERVHAHIKSGVGVHLSTGRN